jgi:archaellum component FlaC
MMKYFYTFLVMILAIVPVVTQGAAPPECQSLVQFRDTKLVNDWNAAVKAHGKAYEAFHGHREILLKEKEMWDKEFRVFTPDGYYRFEVARATVRTITNTATNIYGLFAPMYDTIRGIADDLIVTADKTRQIISTYKGKEGDKKLAEMYSIRELKKRAAMILGSLRGRWDPVGKAGKILMDLGNDLHDTGKMIKQGSAAVETINKTLDKLDEDITAIEQQFTETRALLDELNTLRENIDSLCSSNIEDELESLLDETKAKSEQDRKTAINSELGAASTDLDANLNAGGADGTGGEVDGEACPSQDNYGIGAKTFYDGQCLCDYPNPSGGGWIVFCGKRIDDVEFNRYSCAGNRVNVQKSVRLPDMFSACDRY